MIGMTHNPAGQIVTRSSSNDAYAWTAVDNTATSYTPNALNQYATIGSTSASYDARGNLKFGTGNYDYSAENRLTAAPGSVALSYDPMGRLDQTAAAGVTTKFEYDGDRLVSEYNASNQLRRRYIHGPSFDEPLVWSGCQQRCGHPLLAACGRARLDRCNQ